MAHSKAVIVVSLIRDQFKCVGRAKGKPRKLVKLCSYQGQGTVAAFGSEGLREGNFPELERRSHLSGMGPLVRGI